MPVSGQEVFVGSVYADVLEFRLEVDHRAIVKLNGMLRSEIAPRSIEKEGTLYDIATTALAACRSDPNLPQRVDRVLDAMKKESLHRLHPDEWQLIRRLTVLFAWVRAWVEELDPKKRVTRVRSFLGFARGDKDATISYNRLIRGGDTPTERKGRWHQPLTRHHNNGRKSADFRLDADQPEALTLLETHLCIRYADEVLGWIEDSPQGLLKYPRWMTEPDEKPLAP